MKSEEGEDEKKEEKKREEKKREETKKRAATLTRSTNSLKSLRSASLSPKSEQPVYKVVVLGPSCGKTCFISHFLSGSFDPDLAPTGFIILIVKIILIVLFLFEKLAVEYTFHTQYRWREIDRDFKIDILDTSGAEEYANLHNDVS